MKTLTKFANAKINLGLQILNKRNDGFHNINTIFVPISLSDVITIEESTEYELSCNVDFKIPIEKNLAVVAAKLLNHYADENRKIKITLSKNIPHGAGLGGGSSDAASVLLGMNELFEYGLSQEELATIGLQIGSDVPFFIYNRSASATGRGEQFEFIDFALDCSVLLVFPNIPISSGEAYKALDRTNEIIEKFNFKDFLHANNIAEYKDNIINDFEPFAFSRHPEISDIKTELYRNGSIFALMSGSGSCLFGLFPNDESALLAANSFANYRTYLCRII